MSIFEEQRETIKSMILKKSVDLFKEHGYEKVSIAHIAKDVGMAKATFYNYYSAKRDILMLWADQEFKLFESKKAANPNVSIQENLYCLVELLVKAISDSGKLFSSFLKEMVCSNVKGEVENQFDFISIFSTVINHSVDYKKMSEDFEEKVMVFNRAMFLTVTEWFKYNEKIEGLEQKLKKVVDICLYGMISR